jgi:hypothetical protein
LHEYFEARTYFKGSDSNIDGLKVPEPIVEEVKAREVDILHFVEVDHTFLHFFVPAKPGLLLLAELLQHFFPFDRVVLAVHRNEVAVQRDSLYKQSSTIMSLGVILDLE